MDGFNLLSTVALISMFISLLLSYFLVKVKTEHNLSNRLFALFLVLTTIDLSGILFDLWYNSPSNFGMFRNLMIFLQLPTFYLYALSVCYYDFRLKTKHILHIVPFLTANLILLPRFYLVGVSSKINFVGQNSNRIEIQLTHIFLHFQIVVYIIAVFMILRKAKKIYLENYTGAKIESLNWLLQFTIAISLFYFIALIKNIFKFTHYPNVSEWLKVGLFLFELFIVSWYLFKALNNPNLFRNVDSRLKLVKSIISDKENNEPITGTEKEFNFELAQLKKYMIEKKPFLNPSVTIQDISNDIQIPTRDLSLLINQKLGQHFFDFINSYRVENAMSILKDSTKNKMTILEILYEVGFNSKSSFNTAFKKHCGITPTEYRKSL